MKPGTLNETAEANLPSDGRVMDYELITRQLRDMVILNSIPYIFIAIVNLQPNFGPSHILVCTSPKT